MLGPAPQPRRPVEAPQPKVPSSRSWNPAVSPRLLEAVGAIVDLYRQGTLTQELRPLTLVNLGGEFAKLYHAAFHREGRPEWATTKYPNGFADLVAEINHCLAAEGISILNTKRTMLAYKRLPQDQCIIVSALEDLYRKGEISREEIRRELAEHQVILSTKSFDKHFPDGVVLSASNRDTSLRRVAVNEIAKRVEEVKKGLDFDLSIDSCLRGLIFEHFVGAYLTDLYGRDAVRNQTKVPIAYRDLDGIPHSFVLLDFTVNGQPIEVKLRNPYENIITSALAQSYSIEGLTGEATKVSVICRHRCPFMQMAYDDNIPIRQEAEAMGLSDFRYLERRIKDVLTYRTIDELLEADLNGTAWRQRLTAIEAYLQNQPTNTLKKAARYLGMVAQAPDECATRLDIALKCLAESRELSREEQRRLLGGSTVVSPEERKDFENRMRFLVKRIDQAHETLALNLYNFIYGTKHERLSLEQIKELSALDSTKFQDGCLDWLATREKARLERIAKQPLSKEEEGVISAYERSRERYYKHRFDELRRILNARVDDHKALGQRLERANAYDRTFDLLKQFRGERFITLLREQGLWPKNPKEQQRLVTSASRSFAEAARAREGATACIQRIGRTIEAWNALPHDQGAFEGDLATQFQQLINTERRGLLTQELNIRGTKWYQVVHDLARKVETQVKDPQDPRRIVLSNQQFSLALNFERLALDFIDAYLELKHTALSVDAPSRLVPMNLLSVLTNLSDPLNCARAMDHLLASATISLYGNISLSFESRGALLNWARQGGTGRVPLEKYVGVLPDGSAVIMFKRERGETFLPYIEPHAFLTQCRDRELALLKSISPQSFVELERAIEVTRETLVHCLDDIKGYCALAIDPSPPYTLPTIAHVGSPAVVLAFTPGERKGIKDIDQQLHAVQTIGAESHILSNIGLCDYLSRKCGQARVLSFYSPEIARDFYLSPHLSCSSPEDFQSITRRLAAASLMADEDFEQLLFGARKAGP